MIPLPLTPEQAERYGADRIQVDEVQARQWTGALRSGLRKTKVAGGRPRTHVCSDPAHCATCRRRESRAAARGRP